MKDSTHDILVVAACLLLLILVTLTLTSDTHRYQDCVCCRAPNTMLASWLVEV